MFTASRKAIEPKNLELLLKIAADGDNGEVVDADNWDDVVAQGAEDSDSESENNSRMFCRSVRTSDDDEHEVKSDYRVLRRSSRKRVRVDSESEHEVESHLTSSPDPSPIRPSKRRRTINGMVASL